MTDQDHNCLKFACNVIALVNACDPDFRRRAKANPGFMILQEYITRAETKEPPCPECGQPYVSARARGLAEDAAQRFGDIALEKNTPEGHYARGAIGQAERTAKDISALCDAADLLHGMVGLIDLLLNRDDLTDELRGVLLNNHRVVDARAALAKHAAKP